jgi:hypothetical protein
MGTDGPQRTSRRTLLSWSALCLAAVESICAGMVALSGVRVVLGMSSLIGATAAGPAQGFHREGLRVPILWISGVIAAVNLLLVWNESRMRGDPAAQWRLQPLTSQQRRQRWIQIATSVAALLLIAAEVLAHPWFHREF